MISAASFCQYYLIIVAAIVVLLQGPAQTFNGSCGIKNHFYITTMFSCIPEIHSFPCFFQLIIEKIKWQKIILYVLITLLLHLFYLCILPLGGGGYIASEQKYIHCHRGKGLWGNVYCLRESVCAVIRLWWKPDRNQ